MNEIKFANHVLDPFYSKDKPEPSAGNISFLNAASDASANWLYNWGDMERYMFARVKIETMREARYIGFPGRFSEPRRLVFFRKYLSIDDPLKYSGILKIYYCGELKLFINNMPFILLEKNDASPSELDIRKVLVKGNNTIMAMCTNLAGVPALAIDSDIVKTNASWGLSLDTRSWGLPMSVYPFMDNGLYPHEEHLPCRKIEPLTVKNGLYDFGTLMLGNLKIESFGSGRLRIIPGESVPEAMNENELAEEQLSSWISANGNDAVLKGSRMAFRYARIKTEGNLKLKKVSADVEACPMAWRGSFRSSDKLLDRIWDVSANTLRLCSRELILDALKRDRLPWGGDFAVGALCQAFSFADQGVLKRTLIALAPPEPDKCHVNGIIDYSFYWLLGLAQYYLYFGDKCTVRNLFPFVNNIMNAFEASENKDGFISPIVPRDWLFIDWADGLLKEGNVAILQMLYVQALEASASLALSADDTSLAGRWSKKALKLRKNCLKSFWDETEGAFAEKEKLPPGVLKLTRHANAFAVLSGVAGKKHFVKLWENIFANKAVPEVGTPYMKFFELSACSRIGKFDEVLDEIRKYWGCMLAGDEGSAFWEGLKNDDNEADNRLSFYKRPFGRSLCHAWSAGPLVLLSAELLGVKAIEPGWKKFTIERETLPSSLDWVEIEIPTPSGNIFIRAEQGKKLEVRPAPGTQRV